jgi:hypothetical protein
MSELSPYSMFPSKEEWGSGDEAMDNKLSIALKKVITDSSLAAIRDFYYFGFSLKPRAYNPAFHVTIEMVTKALLSILDPAAPIDHQMLKLKGHYDTKTKVNFEFGGWQNVLSELKNKKVYRYKNQIDFHLALQAKEERNPFVRYGLVRSPYEFHVKILMKDFRSYLTGEKAANTYDDAFFHALRMKDNLLFIEHFGEFWYHEGQIFSLPHFEL